MCQVIEPKINVMSKQKVLWSEKGTEREKLSGRGTFNVMKTYKKAGGRNRRILQTYFKPYP